MAKRVWYALLFGVVFVLTTIFLRENNDVSEFNEACMAHCTKDGTDEDVCRMEICVN